MSLQRELRPGQPRISLLVRGLLAAALITMAGSAAAEQRSAPPQRSSIPQLSGSSADQRLRLAVEQGKLPLLEAAIAQNANVNCATPANDLPPLLELLRSATAPLDRARRECVACLLAHGAKVDVADSDQRTPVIHATRLGDLDTLRLLVDAEAFVRTRDRFHKTALFYAVEANRRDIVLYLAQNGALISLSVKERKRMGQR